MMPNWFPWIVVGGILFILLGWVSTRYKERAYQRIQTIQDFISGAICIGLMGVTMPELFPSLETFPSLAGILQGVEVLSSSDSKISDDEILQVGPPRLVRY